MALDLLLTARLLHTHSAHKAHTSGLHHKTKTRPNSRCLDFEEIRDYFKDHFIYNGLVLFIFWSHFD